MGGTDHADGLYAHEITLKALQEKLRIMHDVVSGRKFYLLILNNLFTTSIFFYTY